VNAALVDAIQLDPATQSGIPQGFPAAPIDPRTPARQMEPDKY
jgi:hypothetical protein